MLQCNFKDAENLRVAHQKPKATIEFQEFYYAVVYKLVENPDKELPTYMLCFMLCCFIFNGANYDVHGLIPVELAF